MGSRTLKDAFGGLPPPMLGHGNLNSPRNVGTPTKGAVMTPTDAQLDALLWANRVSFSITQPLTCHKGHFPCFTVRMSVDTVIHGQYVQRWLGPFEHQTMIEALDVVSMLSAHHGSALELRANRDLLEERQEVLDLDV